ncbi:type II toxin-antitoxin system VapC family toxin [Caenispirillum bisanense]|uniref:type II toxin-antitoxin system VapC family toxin n=1 Tax=Caenispirillum bisanense TaxID=414052 RepID=UPI0031D75C71
MRLAIDASALVAIVLHEPERDMFLQVLSGASEIYVSPVSLLEARIAVHRVGGFEMLLRLDKLLTTEPFTIALHSAADVDIAWTAFLAYGKGSGSGARLNLGDLFSYAVAKRWQAPLLYKGDDFSRTDLPAAALPA